MIIHRWVDRLAGSRRFHLFLAKQPTQTSQELSAAYNDKYALANTLSCIPFISLYQSNLESLIIDGYAES